jgi:23S rRNA pseudouridine1911/1915/1917 synthase
MEGRERWLRHTVDPTEAGRTVEEILRGPMEISGRMIQRLTRSRGIRLGSKPGQLGRRVRPGEVVSARVAPSEKPTLAPVRMDLAIVHEDDDLIVVDKPAGLLVHPTSATHRRTLAHGLASHFRDRGIDAPVRPVHRLDRETSGLLLVAKSAFAHQHLDRQLRQGEVAREYLAIVEGSPTPASGVVDSPIGRTPGRPGLRAVRADGDRAVTRFETLDQCEGLTLLRIRLETGRTHQIRVHLAHIGHPVAGDRVYGASPRPGFERHALHAARIGFRHPRSAERLSFSSPLPAELATLLAA